MCSGFKTASSFIFFAWYRKIFKIPAELALGMPITAGFELAARYSQFANVNSQFANAKSSILRMTFCKNNVNVLKWKSSPFCASVLLITMWGPLMWTSAQISNVSNFSEHKLHFIFI
jgi:hypothetical protein